MLIKKINPKTNTIYRGDNLQIMKAMPDACVDMIYIDPPYYSQTDYKKNLFGDRESSAAFDNEAAEFKDTRRHFEALVSTGEKGIEAYLTWLRLRLLECHRLLKPTGCFFVQLDYHAVHYAKVILDEIFGYQLFRNEIIWKRVNNAKAQTKDRLGTTHDTILFYAKSKQSRIYEKPRGKYSEQSLKAFSRDDGDGRGPYQTVPMIAAGLQKEGRKVFSFQGVTAPWLYSMENLKDLWERGLVVRTKGGSLRKKQYLNDSKGPEIGTIWHDENVAPIQGGDEEYTGYPTQKPVPLLERILMLGSQEGDFVFDAFAGCGSLMHAAHNLKRKWMGIDISTTAIKVNEERLSSLGAKVNIVDVNDLVDLRRAG